MCCGCLGLHADRHVDTHRMVVSVAGCVQGMQLFGFKFASCSVDGAQKLCPPGTAALECPPYPDCYVPCRLDQAFDWINVTGELSRAARVIWIQGVGYVSCVYGLLEQLHWIGLQY